MHVFPGHWGIMTYRFWQGAKRTLAALVPAALVLAGARHEWLGAARRRPAARLTSTRSIASASRRWVTSVASASSPAVNGEAYALTADAKIDTAIFDYRGNMSSNGAVPSRTPHPVDYKFNYKQKTFLKKKKVKALNIAFNGGASAR